LRPNCKEFFRCKKVNDGLESGIAAGRAFGEAVTDACEHAEDPVGIGGGKLEAVEHFSDLIADALVGAGLDVTGLGENLMEGLGEALAIGRGGRTRGRWRGGFGSGGGCMASELIEADGDGLAEIHGFLQWLGGDVQEGGTVGEVVIAEAAFF